jgi:hypothetical protein
MKLKFLIFLACLSLISGFANKATADPCPCPDCPPCYAPDENCDCVYVGCVPACSGCYNYCNPDCVCEYVCSSDRCEECVNNQCKVCGGDTSKCCDNGTCVKKCDPTGGGLCTHTEPFYSACHINGVGDPSCAFPGEEVCGWNVVDGPEYNATCASCAPDCRVLTEPCVLLKPRKCYDGLDWWPPWYKCWCEEARGVVNTYPEGSYYKCK